MNRLPLFLMALMSFLLSNTGLAAVIDVACDDQALVDAIDLAEANGQADTLNLADDCRYEFSQASFNGTLDLGNGSTRVLGATALPVINTEITINGNNSTIERLDGSPRFRHIVVETDGDLTLSNLTLLNGHAATGVAGISAFAFGNTGSFRGIGMPGGSIGVNGSLTLEQCTLSNNRAGDSVNDPNNNFALSGNGGGAVFVSVLSPRFVAERTTFFNNSSGAGATFNGTMASSGSGGALRLGGESAVIKNSLFDSNNVVSLDSPPSNRVAIGSAIVLAGSNFISENNTYSNNGNRGAASVIDIFSLPTASNSFTHDTYSAPPGETLFMTMRGSTAEFNASIFSSDQRLSFTCNPGATGNDAFGEDNLIDSPSLFIVETCNFQDGVDGNVLDSSPNDNLAPLADNGGPTLTHALLTGSLAIDAALGSNCPATDQRGESRDANCDIGAFEFIEEEPSDDEICFPVRAENGAVAVICL